MLMFDISFESYMKTALIFPFTFSFIWVICNSPRKKDSRGKHANSIAHLKKKFVSFLL